MITFKEKADSKKDVEGLLHPIVKQWFFSRFQEFSSPQLYGVTEVHARNNILVSASTGSGKTLTSFLSILNELVDCAEKGVLQDKIYAVYVSPLKALNRDVSLNLLEPLEEMEKQSGKKLGIRVAVRTGDTTANEKQKMLKACPHILITTPESLAILLSSTKFSEHLKQVDWTIIDEAHAIADSKRGVHLSLSLERLQRLSPGMCRIGLSATISPLDVVAQYLVGVDRDCKIIDVQSMKKYELELLSPVEDFVSESYQNIEKKTYELLDTLIHEHKTTLIFTNTRAATERVVHHLKDTFPHKYESIDEETKEKSDLIGAHHGSLSKEHRLKMENNLREGKMKAIVCLEGNTEILTADGNWKKIKDIAQDTVQSLNTQLKLNNNLIKAHVSKENIDSLVKITTGIGKEITATKEHKFLIINKEGALEWKEAQFLTDKDFVATTRKYNYIPLSEKEIKELLFDAYPNKGYLLFKTDFLFEIKNKIKRDHYSLKNYWKLYLSEIISYSTFKNALNGKNLLRIDILRKILKNIQVEKNIVYDAVLYISSDKYKTSKVELSEDFLRLLGMMLADGYLSKSALVITNRNKKILSFYKQIIEKLSGKACFETVSSSGTPVLMWHSVFLAQSLESLGFIIGKKAKICKIPDFIFRLSSSKVSAFISGYIDGDGFIEIKSDDNRPYSIGFSTTSKRLAKDLQKILLREGIVSSIRSSFEDSVQKLKSGREIIKYGWFYDVVVLGGEHLRNFAEFIFPERENLRRIKEILPLQGHCNIDVIPNIGSLLKEERKNFGISTYAMSNNAQTNSVKYELGVRNISRHKLKSLLQTYNSKNPLLSSLAQSDLFWEKIDSIEIVKPTSFVYNVEVDIDHNYVANGFLTKNCSTSLELGIDIGYIDLVVCLGSPKSVARLLQRLGRSGHRLHDTVKGKILVQDRDDLVECAVMLKFAKEKKMDRIHIPTNCLDVLAQQLFGMALEEVWDVKDMYKAVKSSYCYRDLTKKDFEEVLDYLAGNFISLEERYIYARIWWNKEEGKVGKKGRMSRVIYMTNIGTIPDHQGVIVKDQRGNKIGMIDEAFLEKLGKGDIFVLGGNTYQFNFARGMVAQVIPMPGKRPTVPSWYSDRLPLSYDLANGIGNFRQVIEDKFKKKLDKKEVLQFIHEYLYVDKVAGEALYNYCKDQYDYIGMPSSKKLLIEHYRDEHMKNYVVFHALYGRRVNDVLSRAVAYAISRAQHKDVEIGISDNGFYVSYDRNVNVSKAFSLLKSKELRKVLELAVDKSEILKRRFRHCAGRALMILRTYGGIKKRVGRQQVSSMILLNAVRRISENFFILRETRREVLEDLMDYDSALEVLQKIEEKKITIEEIHTFIPSPFALNLVMQGYSDILRLEDKQQFLQRMHQMVKAKIALKNR